MQNFGDPYQIAEQIQEVNKTLMKGMKELDVTLHQYIANDLHSMDSKLMRMEKLLERIAKALENIADRMP